jgi:hypothetical protein
MIMKKFIFLLLISLSINLHAQTVEVLRTSESVNGENAEALKMTLLIADSKKVERLWTTFLKNFGKIQSSDGIFIVQEALIDGISASVTSASNITCYSRVTLKEEGTEIWWVLQEEDKYIGPDFKENKFSRAERMFHQFGVDVYVNEINEDISDADRVIDNAAKEYDRLLRLSESLNKRMEKNGYEKIRLEEKLVENFNDSTQVNLQMQQNTIDQENALLEIQKLKEARESIRGKLEEVK